MPAAGVCSASAGNVGGRGEGGGEAERAGLKPGLDAGGGDVFGIGVNLADKGEVGGVVGGARPDQGQGEFREVLFQVGDLAEVAVDQADVALGDPAGALLDHHLEQG